jgi:hypothetical protein
MAILPSVVEQADACKAHGHAVRIAGGYYLIVPHGAAGLRHILHAAAVRPLNVVAEGEEGIAAKGYAR